MSRRQYTSKPAAAVEFDLDEVHFVAAGGLSLLEVMELARFADVDTDSPEGAVAVGDFFRGLFGCSCERVHRTGCEYDRFRRHCRAHGTDDDTLMGIMQDIMGARSGHPTQRPSVSADGPPTTPPTLRVISSDGSLREEPLTLEREAELREAVQRASAG
jgi:hypothetical protein